MQLLCQWRVSFIDEKLNSQNNGRNMILFGFWSGKMLNCVNLLIIESKVKTNYFFEWNKYAQIYHMKLIGFKLNLQKCMKKRRYVETNANQITNYLFFLWLLLCFIIFYAYLKFLKGVATPITPPLNAPMFMHIWCTVICSAHG